MNRLNWRDYLGQANPVASVLMAKMQIAPEDRPKVKVRELPNSQLEALSEALLDFEQMGDLMDWLRNLDA